MRIPAWRSLLLLLAFSCHPAATDGSPAGDEQDPGATAGEGSAATRRPLDGGQQPQARPDGGTVGRGTSNLRIVAANISSGLTSTYDPGEGIRMFQGIHPDLALIQELNYKTNSPAELDEFTGTAFGAGYTLFRESGPGVGIPNGVASRYPIVESGRWADPNVANRGFAWAKIAIPGSHPLWAVSVHLLTSGTANRLKQATALVAQLQGVIGSGDYVVIGGDFNTDGRSEACLGTFGQLLDTRAPYPADQNGNERTNANRNKPYDWVLTSPTLRAHQVPTVIGARSFPAGLVFDSRVFTPIADVAPVLREDSDAVNMQHMPIVKDFLVAD